MASMDPLLLAASFSGSPAALRVLLLDGEGPPVDVRADDGVPTPAFLKLLEHAGAQEEDAAVDVTSLLQASNHVLSPSLLEGVTAEGNTALHVVATNGDCAGYLQSATFICTKARHLLHKANNNGDTPLHCAARAGRPFMVSHLISLARSGDVDDDVAAGERLTKFLRTENRCSETALHEAVRIGSDRVVELLMAADSELACFPRDGGASPLYLAVLHDRANIAQTLYQKSGGCLSYSGPDGQNALHAAALFNQGIVEVLLHWNKSLTTQVDKNGSTPLHFASSLSFRTSPYLNSPYLLLFLWLLRIPPSRAFRIPRALETVFKANPAALYQADKDGSFPIHVAASVGATNSIRFFYNKSPDSVGLRDAKGRTFLHVAAAEKNRGIVFYACQTPALDWTLNMQDIDGNTALHLAIQAPSFRMFCALFGNRKVNLNLTNNHGETPRDLSRSKLPRGMGSALNSENQVYKALCSVGARHGALRGDKTEEKYSRSVKPEEEEKESEKLKDAAQALVVASILIATVTFSATFAIPGGYRADDHTNGGTPTLAGTYVFDAFIMATTLAFICSTLATVGSTYGAVPMFNMVTRRVNLAISVFFMWSSVTCMSIAFALGVFMVLAPVARNTAVAVLVIIPAVLLGANMESIYKLVILARPLCIRKGLFPGLVQLLIMHADMLVSMLWPFVVTFGWAALARIHHHR